MLAALGVLVFLWVVMAANAYVELQQYHERSACSQWQRSRAAAATACSFVGFGAVVCVAYYLCDKTDLTWINFLVLVMVSIIVFVSGIVAGFPCAAR